MRFAIESKFEIRTPIRTPSLHVSPPEKHTILSTLNTIINMKLLILMMVVDAASAFGLSAFVANHRSTVVLLNQFTNQKRYE